MELVHLKYGYVCDVRPGEVRVQMEDDEFATYWLPVIRRKSKTDFESWPLEANEHVVCLLDMHCNTGICLGAIHSEKDPADTKEAVGIFIKKFSDGTVIEYNKKSNTLTADVKGKIVAKSTGDVEIQAGQNLEATVGAKATIEAQNIELKGEVKIIGNLNVTGTVIGDNVNLKLHTHSNGNNGAPTGQPL
jgi:phage baseplate assembly protein V